ncbi:aminotransferase class I/II-fold pyridoxal phosphate-dependent enzyme [Pseudodesulfovibrio sp.]|nr:aminotransferase class I/II-fold pyridoxal phosphate-dependent enzyme [Pseudodesulfovibrio sp.]
MKIPFAKRIDDLGTETAFAVAAKAMAHAAKGNDVFPFHLGDMNLITPENVREAATKAMNDGKTGYNPSYGIPQLREALANDINRTHDTSYGMENVAIQPGGKPVISKFILALMNPGDEVLYPNPGYPIYESQIEFHGGVAVPYGIVRGENNFSLDIDELEKSITDKTKLLIVNDLHNPTGAECSVEDHKRLAELAVKHDLMVLVDEAYFEIRYEGESKSLVQQPGMVERSVLLYTFSKRFAMTGWRLGAAIGPQEIIDIIAKINVNDESCSNHFIQYGAVEGLTGDQSGCQFILKTLNERRDKCVDLLNTIEGVHCYRPSTTFYLYPEVTGAMANKGFDDYEAFTGDILEKTGVSMCTRAHFGRPLPGEESKYVRFAYSGIDVDRIEEGLGLLKQYLES